MALSKNQKLRIKQLREYVTKVQANEQEHFVEGHRSVYINIKVYLILIETDQ